MPTVVKTTHPVDDPLGYDGTTLERVRAMARDAIDRRHEGAVHEEAAVLRARLRRVRERASRGPDQER